MTRNFLILFFCLWLQPVYAQQPAVQPAAENIRMPAEWEKHEAVWVGWEHFAPFHQPALNVIKGLLPYVPVKVVAESPFSARVLKEYLHMQGVDSAKVQVFVFPNNRVWLRDHGATFVRTASGIAIADFKWSHYGIRDWLTYTGVAPTAVEETYQAVAKKTGSIDSLMGSSLGVARLHTDVSMEGGSIEVNGRGVLILCEEVTFQRNPGKSKSYIESEFRRVLGARKIIWMKRGLADDPHIIRPITGNYIGFGTGGHTDEFVRFTDENTLLLAWVPEAEKDRHPIHRMNYERMSENLAILQQATDQDGRPFRIIKVPLPELIYKQVTITNYQKNETDHAILSNWISRNDGFRPGDTVNRVAAASYLNYFVTNDVVLLPDYIPYGTSPSRQDSVRQIFEAAFPGRKLIFLDVMNLNYEGGGIHCITQQQPAN